MDEVAHDPGGVANEPPRSPSAPRTEQPAGDGDGAAPDSRTRPLVLVVDDEAAIRLLCRVNLRLEGMETVEAGDGLTALQLARELQPDLLLLDVMMPEIDGWQVAEALARDPVARTIPIVFLSARAEPADYIHGYEIGAVGYVTKPFDPTALGTILSETLARVKRGERDALRRERLDALGEHRQD